MVPRGWQKKRIGDLCKFINGHGFKAAEWSAEGLPIIRIQNLNGSKDFNYYSGVPKKEWLVFPNDLLFAWAGTKGVSFGPSVWKGPKGLLNQHIYKVTAAANVNHEWLYVALAKVTQGIEAQAHGFKATLVHVKKTDIIDQPILVPPTQEQKKIAQILSTWDKAIETTKKLIENSKAQKKALMQQLLSGKRRFSEFVEPWERTKLGSITSINPYRPSGMVQTECVSFVSMSDVSEDAKLLSVKSRNYHDVKNGFTSFIDHDVLVAKITPCFENGKGAYATGLTNGIGFGSTEFHVIRAKGDISAKFIYHITNSHEFRYRGYANMQGSAGQKRVPSSFLKTYVFAMPKDKQEQNKIASALDTIDSQLETLQKQATALFTQKKALMQQLLTGKRRLKLDQSEASEAAV